MCMIYCSLYFIAVLDNALHIYFATLTAIIGISPCCEHPSSSDRVMLPINHSVELDLFPDFHGSSLRSSNHITSKLHLTRTAHTKRNYAIGIGFILIITLLWTLGSFVTQVGTSKVLLGNTYFGIIGSIWKWLQ